MELFLLTVLIAVILFLLFLGVYADMAKRTGVKKTSRGGFLLAPVVYSITVILAFVPLVMFVFAPLFTLDLRTSIRLVIPAGIAFFGLLTAIGTLPLWMIHRKNASFAKCATLSARLMLAPVIDAFWASAAMYVGTMLAIPAFFISGLITLFQSAQMGTDIGGIGNYIFSPAISLPFMVVFLIIGLLSAYFILRAGPSEAMSKYFLIGGIGAFVASLILCGVLFLWLGVPSLVLMIPIFLTGLFVCIYCLITSFLFKTLRITGVFGLSLVISSALILILVLGGTSFLSDIPLAGSNIRSLIEPLVTLGVEVSVLGVIMGILIMALAVRTEEKGQVMTRAMAISVGASSFMPLSGTVIMQVVNLGFLTGLGTIGEILLTFLLVGPIYIVAVCLLRLALAFRIPAKPKYRRFSATTKAKMKSEQETVPLVKPEEADQLKLRKETGKRRSKGAEPKQRKRPRALVGTKDYGSGSLCYIDNYPLEDPVLKCPHCGALFHKGCILSVLELGNSCPKCGQPLKWKTNATS